jgi:flagellar protein FliS
MCYEGAMTHLKLAKEHYLSGKYEAKAKALRTVEDAINELLCGLDFEKGGEIARNLRSIYMYMLFRLTTSDVNEDMDGFDEVLGILGEMKETWKEVFWEGKKELLDSQATPVQLPDESCEQESAATHGASIRL